jgi:hypothetical protein
MLRDDPKEAAEASAEPGIVNDRAEAISAAPTHDAPTLHRL